MAEQGKQLQFNIDPDVAKGIYANLALIVHSPSEFIVDFAAMMPGMQKANVGARVILAPEHAKRLLLALQDNIYKFEQQFGTIKMQSGQQAKTIAPFSTGGNNKGEA
ncbi:MAG: DUF3467 domain-containing protein [Prevotella sp.]|nr:DUF3467 domain-containing protein [Prevotella sp.]MCD8289763.1 DUF3467 domain-containing protein [Prevotella sp.]